ncbi:DUF503 domain-containing protein [Vallitalea pronyensis]|uniref:DUF503 domain-containing protein n=1 Tax=Vallitalea pronyensis TaxID=1348613 RepID=A0A8J8SHF2_9FIRM|nr:DUF503 domain-containing protein [Vallitalea pronyensis]QUI23785.1 DUF503 domain-containing protein [Vallitalea pronyensis]
MYVKSDLVTLRIFNAYSLKDKRSVLKSIIHKVHNKYNVSIAEVDHHDLHNQADLGIAIVGNQMGICDKIFQDIIAFIEYNYPAEILEITPYAH